MTLITYTKLALTANLWGGTFIAARIVTQHVGPFSAAFLRFLIASVFLLFLTIQLEGRIPLVKKRQIIPVTLLGLTGVFAYNVFFFSGLKIIPAGKASIIIATNPVFIALFASIIFKERLKIKNYGGILLCVIGAIIVISHGHPFTMIQEKLGRGEMYIMGCVLCWVAYSLIGKSVMRDISPVAAVTYSCMIGAIMLLLPACLEGMFRDLFHYGTEDWLGIFYLGFFGSVVGFSWYYQGIREIGASRAGVFINLVPVSGIILAFFILKETIDASLMFGAVMIISGAYLTNKRN